ncbi:MAG: hypothetical protein D6808_00745 [Candidatus Dadabacteria bacterium]|nr:MAG: hypothetical protein D6808_00745 [Candidatus Dadabacteria bacterium]
MIFYPVQAYNLPYLCSCGVYFMVDRIVTFFVKLLFKVVNLFSFRFRVALFTWLVRVYGLLFPRFYTVSRTNLRLAFPDKDDKWRENVLRANISQIGRLLADCTRLSSIDKEWVKNNVSFPFYSRYQEIKRKHKTGVLIATGHLGSFELVGFVMPFYGLPLNFIVRSFSLKRLDAWWNSIRELHGNKVISRKGGYQKAVKAIKTGKDVAILFDQNVRRKHGVFVKWFGIEASTTKALALIALKTRCPIMVASVKNLKDGKYQINFAECDVSDIYDSGMSTKDKIREITQRVSSCYQRIIEDFPEGWFWMHRRWKTRPEGEPEDFYS